jgi:hypothetical protein
MKRRTLLKLSATAPWAASALASPAPSLKGKAEHCIFIWLGGGMSQVDTFDPKRLGNPSAKPSLAGSSYKAIDTSVPGVQVTQHLARTAALMEHVTAVRTVNHRIIDEHAFATNLVHTGRTTSGNVIYPSLGSIVAHQRGALDPSVPAYMLIGYPNVSRGPGFLGAKAGFVYLTDTTAGPAGFTRQQDVSPERAAARTALLQPLQQRFTADSTPADYLTAQQEALRLAGPSFMRHFQLDAEPAALRQSYGGEFGQRCLLARRLVQSGVRFVEVSHNLNFVNGTGWDSHNKGQLSLHVIIQELDHALSALITDLKTKQLLDKTLIVIGTEFGRPAEFDSGGGSGHQGTTHSLVLAGGGLKHRGAYGVTDEISKTIVQDPVSIPDFHATVHAALGIDPHTELLDGSRPVPITDGGHPISALFA